MTSSQPDQSTMPTDPATSPPEASATPAKSAQRSPTTGPTQSGITAEQAEQIIAQLKSLKQNVFILTLVAGFFALRALLFHR